MSRLCPPKPKPWNVSQRLVHPRYRCFWPMSACVPCWPVMGSASIGARDFGHAGLVFKIMDQANPRVISRDGTANEWPTRNGESTFYADWSPAEFLYADNVSPRINAYPFTVFARCRTNQVPGNPNTLFGIGNLVGSATSVWYSVNINTTSRWRIERNDGTTGDAADGTSVPNTALTYNVCAVFWSATLATLYVDGVAEATITTGVTLNAAQVLAVGFGTRPPANTTNWQGNIFVGYLIPRGLTPGEIGLLEADPYGPIRKFQPSFKQGVAPSGGVVSGIFESSVFGGIVR